MKLSLPVGRTDIRLSVVGMGTCQLRMVTEDQAVRTLSRGFELGVNWVHTAPDYGGTEPIIARAIAESGREVMVLSNASGEMPHFAHVFETTLRRFGPERLALFGVSGIDYCEDLGQNVWDAGGMVDYLEEQRHAGRLKGIFCTTHGSPDYVRKLIESDRFDAVMVAFNPLGFHVLSYHGLSEGKIFEDMSRLENEVFPLARDRGVALLVMKPLAGGLLCASRAFPPEMRFSDEEAPLAAEDVLKSILRHPAIHAVVPGTASLEEAEENARAGWAPDDVSESRRRALDDAVDRYRKTLCGRCGECEATCSKGLPISWLFRDAYIWNYPGDSFEALDRKHYFALLPDGELPCTTCVKRTCRCARGLDIPARLARVHARMTELRDAGRLPALPGERVATGPHHAEVVWSEVPKHLAPGGEGLCRIWVENHGETVWPCGENGAGTVPGTLGLKVRVGGGSIRTVPLRHDVGPSQRTHFTFSLKVPRRHGIYPLTFDLVSLNSGQEHDEIEGTSPLFRSEVIVGKGTNRPLSDRVAGAARQGLRSARTLLAGVSKKEIAMNWIRGLKKNLRAKILGREAGDAEPSTDKGSHSFVPAYGARYVTCDFPQRLLAGAVVPVKLVLENWGNFVWPSRAPDGRNVDLVIHCDGELAAGHRLSRPEVHPGETVTVHFPIRAPREPGVHRFRLELVWQQVTFFCQHNIPPLIIEATVEPSDDPTIRAFDTASRVNPWFYQPTRGIARSVEGKAFPVFVKRAEGCRFWDLSDREFIDYTMGWGSVLLGYGYPSVQAALREGLKTAPTVAFPHPAEMDVAERIVEDLPAAEMVVFGKNGSDVCTVATRLARHITGKKIILQCGYHGWQDFWVEKLGFAKTGVPDRPAPLIHEFKYNDLDDFHRLYRKHRADLAAVMVEASGPGAATVSDSCPT